MIDSLRSATALNAVRPACAEPLPVEGEAAGLAAAIQRLIADRDNFRNQATSQEREIIPLRAAGEELRRQNEQIALVRDQYLRLSTELLAQLRHIDVTLKEVAKKT